MNNEFDVFQWHKDMFAVPKGGQLLAESLDCPFQAFKLGSSAYGIQFHMEITEVSIKDWCDKYINKHNVNKEMKEQMLDDYFKKRDKFDHMAEIIFRNFSTIIELKKAKMV